MKFSTVIILFAFLSAIWIDVVDMKNINDFASDRIEGFIVGFDQDATPRPPCVGQGEQCTTDWDCCLGPDLAHCTTGKCVLRDCDPFCSGPDIPPGVVYSTLG